MRGAAGVQQRSEPCAQIRVDKSVTSYGISSLFCTATSKFTLVLHAARMHHNLYTNMLMQWDVDIRYQQLNSYQHTASRLIVGMNQTAGAWTDTVLVYMCCNNAYTSSAC